MKRLALVVMVVAVTPAHSQAFFDGNQLYDLCYRSPKLAESYVMGVSDGASVFKWFLPEGSPVPCIPEGVLSTQTADVACNFVRDHPEHRHLQAPMMVWRSFIVAWPCP